MTAKVEIVVRSWSFPHLDHIMRVRIKNSLRHENSIFGTAKDIRSIALEIFNSIFKSILNAYFLRVTDTSNKGQLILKKMGQIREIWEISLLAIFTK